MHAYQQIEADIRDRIARGNWKAGMILPSRAALAREYGVGLATLERAVSALLAAGVLRAVPGQYTVVADRDERLAATSTPVLQNGRPPAVRRAGSSRLPVLGIVSEKPLAPNERLDNLTGWPVAVARALERAYLVDGGITRFAHIREWDGTQRLSLADTIAQLKNNGATAIAVLDIHASIPTAEVQSLPSILSTLGIPLVHVSDSEYAHDTPHVFYDSPHQGRCAVTHLVEQGFLEFIYIGSQQVPWSIARYEEARRETAAQGLDPAALGVIWGGLGEIRDGEPASMIAYDAAKEMGGEIFSRSNYPRCIIAASDYTAFGLIDAARERDLTPGRDFAILGFDDETRALLYGLTTFRPPLAELGAEAALVLRRIEGGDDCNLQVRRRARLIVRASTLMDSHPKQAATAALCAH